ncbi:hypothetical protein A0H76_351 [Hepatospora eriocheir]|uniref:Uncharacterized protein n=1 Tax=Hepatospora eriocheir TaxID=1081669 RepID=A0A1X0QL71_9MICR|nr:hypothetical protein A0H76_351 [Hepatospora eriocheir]
MNIHSPSLLTGVIESFLKIKTEKPIVEFNTIPLMIGCYKHSMRAILQCYYDYHRKKAIVDNLKKGTQNFNQNISLMSELENSLEKKVCQFEKYSFQEGILLNSMHDSLSNKNFYEGVEEIYKKNLQAYFNDEFNSKKQDLVFKEKDEKKKKKNLLSYTEITHDSRNVLKTYKDYYEVLYAHLDKEYGKYLRNLDGINTVIYDYKPFEYVENSPFWCIMNGYFLNLWSLNYRAFYLVSHYVNSIINDNKIKKFNRTDLYLIDGVEWHEKDKYTEICDDFIDNFTILLHKIVQKAKDIKECKLILEDQIARGATTTCLGFKVVSTNPVCLFKHKQAQKDLNSIQIDFKETVENFDNEIEPVKNNKTYQEYFDIVENQKRFINYFIEISNFNVSGKYYFIFNDFVKRVCFVEEE